MVSDMRGSQGSPARRTPFQASSPPTVGAEVCTVVGLAYRSTILDVLPPFGTAPTIVLLKRSISVDHPGLTRAVTGPELLGSTKTAAIDGSLIGLRLLQAVSCDRSVGILRFIKNQQIYSQLPGFARGPAPVSCLLRKSASGY